MGIDRGGRALHAIPNLSPELKDALYKAGLHRCHDVLRLGELELVEQVAAAPCT